MRRTVRGRDAAMRQGRQVFRGGGCQGTVLGRAGKGWVQRITYYESGGKSMCEGGAEGRGQCKGPNDHMDCNWA